MGVLSLKQFESFNLNEKPDRYLALGAAENTPVPNPFYSILPPTSPLGQGTTLSQRQLWVAYPQFSSLTVQGANTGRAIYHALSLSVNKRLSRGLSFLGSYNNSKLIDNNTTSIVNERHYRAVSPMDVPQVFRLAFNYRLPWTLAGAGFASKVARHAATGWLLGGYVTMESGGPLSISETNGRPIRLRNAALGSSVSARLGDNRDASGKVLNPYFDTSAFQRLPNQYTVTPEPPRLDELRGPASRSLNVTLSKTFSIDERAKLEFRAESLNVMNSPNFNDPGTNMSSASTFGVITGAGGNRTMQGMLRLRF